jgi:hypothetical protein
VALSVKRLGERGVAHVVELALAAALLVFLGVAAVMFFRMLDRIDIHWAKGLPVAALFAGAAWLAVGRLRRGWRRLRIGDENGSS